MYVIFCRSYQSFNNVLISLNPETDKYIFECFDILIFPFPESHKRDRHTKEAYASFRTAGYGVRLQRLGKNT